MPLVAQNAHSTTIVPPISMPYPAPSDPEHINITTINIDTLTEAWATVSMPAEIGPNQHGNLRCKVNTDASSNVMLLHVFAKLLPRLINGDGKPTRLYPCDTTLMAYNGSNIPQFGILDTATEWTPKGHQHSKCLQTRWYVADSPGPAILGLPSSSKLGIVQLNCTVKFTSRYDPPMKPATECAKDRHHLTCPLNSTKTSSRPILTGLRVLVNSLQLMTSLSVTMPNLWYMCPESVQLLCDPWYVTNLMSSLTKA